MASSGSLWLVQLRLQKVTEQALRELRGKYKALSPFYDVSLTKLANGLLTDNIQRELRRFRKKQNHA